MLAILPIRDLLADVARALSLLIASMRFLVVLLARRLFGRRLSPREIGVRLCRFCEEQGLIYRKLGQYLTIRTDLLHPDICDELTHLLDAAKPMPFEEVRRIVEQELGTSLFELFTSFESEPVGSASVAQVHSAIARDGEQLAIKVQRSNVHRDFLSESRNFRRLARFSDLLGLTGRVSIRALVNEFIEFTSREMDFQLEGRTADRLRRDLTDNGYVPRIRWDLTSPRVLSMEYIEGISMLALCRLSEAGRTDEIARLLPGVDNQQLITGLANACFRQFFETGFFHGDPHPANILVRSDNSFVFVDCGIFGELSAEDRSNLEEHLEALAEGRYNDSAETYMRMCSITPWTNVVDWKHDLMSVLAVWHRTLKDRNTPRALRNIAQWQGRIIETLRKHHVSMLPNFLLVWRAIGGLNASALRLSSHFNLQQAMLDYFRQRRLNAVTELLEWHPLSEQEQVGPSRRASLNWQTVLAYSRPPVLTIRFSKAPASWSAPALAARVLALAGVCSGAVILLQPVPSEHRVVLLAILTVVLLLFSIKGGRAV